MEDLLNKVYINSSTLSVKKGVRIDKNISAII